MKTNVMVPVLAAAFAALLAGRPAAAQSAPPPEAGAAVVQEFTVEAEGVEPADVLAPDDVEIEMAAAPIGEGRQAVQGAPYSAEAVTEVVRTLSDGNRIVRQSTASVYRDGAGRTRREQGLAVVGALVGNADGPHHVVINDSVAGVTYILDPDAKTAHKLSPPRIRWMGAPPQGGPDGTFDQAVPPPPPGAGPRVMYRARMRGKMTTPVVEPLGKQTIEGVEAEGTRSTITIPAGQIGNEQPIRIVSERWYSPELKVLVQSKRSDPRYGDSTYRLTNIVRAEPAASLFEVPSDYTVSEGPGNVMYHRGIRR